MRFGLVLNELFVSMTASGMVEGEVLHSMEYPPAPLDRSDAGSQLTSMVGSGDHIPSAWLELEKFTGFAGLVWSMKKGPR